MTEPTPHHVEPDGYCQECGTVGCRAPRPRGPRPATVAQVLAELGELRAQVGAIALAVGIAAPATCPACGTRALTPFDAGAPCPNCGTSP